MYRRYKIRLLPTKEQEVKLWEHVHACRFLWNYMLEYQQKRCESGEKWVSYYDMTHELKRLKDAGEHDWLKQVCNTALQQECRCVEEAFKAFFKGSRGHPRFKSKKRGRMSYPARTETFRIIGNCVSLSKVGRVRYKTDLLINESTKFHSVWISYINGKWLAVFALDREKQAVQLSNLNMGIDLGVKETACVAFGDECLFIPNINKSLKMRKLHNRLAHMQRRAARKYVKNRTKKKSRNAEKLERKIGELESHIAHVKQDFDHKLTHQLVEFLPQRIVMETLDIDQMIRGRSVGSYIAQQNWGAIISMIRYKSEDRGIEFVQAPRYFPSSKMCSNCGYIKRDLQLRDRVFVCPNCGNTLDRDYNAAINLRDYKPTLMSL